MVPIKILSIPRLELQAAVLAIRLSETIKRELRVKINPTRFWTDSEIVLRWINSVHCKYATFIANRVSEILHHSSADQWGFVAGNSNPADDCTRGVNLSAFDNTARWFSGGDFLQNPHNPPDFQLLAPGTNDAELLKVDFVGINSAFRRLHPTKSLSS